MKFFSFFHWYFGEDFSICYIKRNMERINVKPYIWITIFIIISLIIIVFAYQKHRMFLTFSEYFVDKKYEDAIQLYVDKKVNSRELHNIGNAYLEEFTENFDGSDISLLEKSVESYEKSIWMSPDEDTTYNYIYAKNLLDSYKNQQEEEQEKQEEEDSQQWEDGQQQGENESASGSGSQNNNGNTAISQRNEEFFLNESDKLSNMSEDEKKQLEQYIEKLKEDQLRNQKYFWKARVGNEFDERIKNFFGGINRGWEKDW